MHSRQIIARERAFRPDKRCQKTCIAPA